MKKCTIRRFCSIVYSSCNGTREKAKFETVVIQTSAECGDCEDRIESMLNYTKGVKFSELDIESKS